MNLNTIWSIFFTLRWQFASTWQIIKKAVFHWEVIMLWPLPNANATSYQYYLSITEADNKMRQVYIVFQHCLMKTLHKLSKQPHLVQVTAVTGVICLICLKPR